MQMGTLFELGICVGGKEHGSGIMCFVADALGGSGGEGGWCADRRIAAVGVTLLVLVPMSTYRCGVYL